MPQEKSSNTTYEALSIEQSGLVWVSILVSLSIQHTFPDGRLEPELTSEESAPFVRLWSQLLSRVKRK